MKQKINKQLGFTLIEVLVASFIFASILGIVYALLNDTLISKKQLELTLTINNQVENANEVLQTVMREANGDFFTDGDFGVSAVAAQASGFQTAHLFFVSDYSYDPTKSTTLLTILPTISAPSGQYLYIKVSEDNTNKIYCFSLENDNNLYVQSWKETSLTSRSWVPDQSITPTPLLQYDPGQTGQTTQFTVAQKNNGGVPVASSIYKPNDGNLTPMNLYVQLTATAVIPWGNKPDYFERQLDQTYVPLITSNPYL
jgi:prepilin-type N-terminal cleavage/methylation domain-containing protein